MDEAYLIAQRGYILAIEAQMQGMIAENLQRVHRGEPMAYTDKDFDFVRGEAERLANNIMQNR